MNYLGKSALTCLMLLLAGNSLSACELPAHPSAMAMPISITTKGGTSYKFSNALSDTSSGVKLIQGEGNAQFYYLIPEGSEVTLKMVWDPVCHNNPDTSTFERKKEEYEYIVDGHNDGAKIPIDQDVGVVGGFGFFSLDAMKTFFTLNGNRKDVKEAFTREKNGVIEDVKYCGLEGPAPLFGAFAGKGENLQIDIYPKAKAKNYMDAPTVAATAMSVTETKELSKYLPGVHWNFKVREGGVYIYDASTKKAKLDTSFMASKTDSEDTLLVYSKSGLLMSDIDYGLEEPKYESYKAYILDNDNKERVHVDGIGYDKDAPDAANGANKGIFTVRFTTPSIGGSTGGTDAGDASLKIMVNSPPAGYKLSNIFWIWTEEDYKRIKKGEVEVEGSADKLDCTDDAVYVYEKSEKARKCSAGIEIVIDKPQDGIGYAAYKVYDNCGPVSTKLQIKGEENCFSEEDGKTDKKSLSSTFSYKITMLDSNPFIDKKIVAVAGEEINGRNISQNTDKMKVTFYYNYPIYEYAKKTIGEITKLPEGGLVDLAIGNENGQTPSFKTYTYKDKWYWKKASEVTVGAVKIEDKINGDDGRLIGSVSTIEGTFTIDNPKPWHSPNDANFSVFAVLKDPAGNTHISEVFKTDSTKDSSENPCDKTRAVYPLKDKEYAGKEMPGNIESYAPYNLNDLMRQVDSSWDPEKWQNMQYIKTKDMTAPEIQVIVLDTRTNRYHIFGTQKDVAAGYSKFASIDGVDDYADVEEFPYIGRNSDISKTYSYTGLVDVNGLYDTYLKGPEGSGNAVSTIKDDLNKNGFVCQKGTRLIFYPHVFDNVINKEICGFDYKLVDCNGKEIENKNISIVEAGQQQAIQYVFRQDNFDKDGKLKADHSPYKLIINAKDESDNERQFELDIGVIGRTLDIRTLEEKRERVE